MMSLEAIRDLSNRAARRAKRSAKEPKSFSPNDLKPDNVFDAIRTIPNLGKYLPPDWARVSLEAQEGEKGVYMGDNNGYGAFMVDASGFGRPDEPALTVQQFSEKLKPGLAYAIVEEGQFQVKIGVFALKVCRDAHRLRAA